MSRCTMPFECMKASAEAICANDGEYELGGGGNRVIDPSVPHHLRHDYYDEYYDEYYDDYVYYVYN